MSYRVDLPPTLRTWLDSWGHLLRKDLDEVLKLEAQFLAIVGGAASKHSALCNQ